MLLGPGPPPKRNRNANGLKERERALGTGGSSMAGSSAETSLGVERGVTGESSRDPTPARASGEGWNRKRYQREDEVLWGHELQEEDGNDPSAARLRSTTSSSSGNYYYPISPAVNDLHPPTISTLPANKSQMKWMLQPPPSAKIMAGKEPAASGSSRSRSDSGGSKGSSLRRGESSLGKLVGEKLMEEKRKRGEDAGSFVMMSRMSSKESKLSRKEDGENEMGMGQRHDRERERLSVMDVHDDDHVATKPPPVTTAAAVGPALVHGQRPPLSTIPSTSLLETSSSPRNPKTPRQGGMIPLGDIGNRQITTASSDSDMYENSPSPNSPDRRRDWKFPPMMDGGGDVSPNAENQRPLTRWSMDI